MSWVGDFYEEILRLDKITRIGGSSGWTGPAYRRHRMPPLDPVGGELVELPRPRRVETLGVWEALTTRRSVREFEDEELGLEDLSNLLHMAFGVTAWEPWVYGHRLYPLRSFPSAGALQPVEIYLWARLVRGLEKGIYRYSFTRHALEVISRGNFEGEIIRISLGQDHAAGGSGSVILSAKWVRSSWKYGARGYKYSLLDTGMAAENFYIASTAAGLGTCAIGAFYEEELCRLVRANCETEIPLLIMPFGRPRKQTPDPRRAAQSSAGAEQP